MAVDSASFASAGFRSGMEALTLEFIDEETREKLAPDMVLTGKSGEGFMLPNCGNPRLGNGYELHKTDHYSQNGIFGETTQITCEYGYIFDGIKDGGEYCSPAEFKLKGIKNVTKVQMDGVTLTPDGYFFTVKKTVMVLSRHTGGTATCTAKAKCEVCGESYGERGQHRIPVLLELRQVLLRRGGNERNHQG